MMKYSHRWPTCLFRAEKTEIKNSSILPLYYLLASIQYIASITKTYGDLEMSIDINILYCTQLPAAGCMDTLALPTCMH